MTASSTAEQQMSLILAFDFTYITFTYVFKVADLLHLIGGKNTAYTFDKNMQPNRKLKSLN